MKLFYSPTSPFARKVRVLIAEKPIAGIDQIIVSPFDIPRELAAINPLSRVPTLQLDSGQILYDSPVIVQYLDAIDSRFCFLPTQGDARWNILRRQALADGMMDTTLALALEINRRPKQEQSLSWIAHWVNKLERCTDWLEQEIKQWPDGFDLGHIATACALSYIDFRASKLFVWREGRPALSQWHARVVLRPSMVETEIPC